MTKNVPNIAANGTMTAVITFIIQAILLVSIGSYWAGSAFGRLDVLEAAAPSTQRSQMTVLQMEVRQARILTDLNQINEKLEEISRGISVNYNIHNEIMRDYSAKKSEERK
tara:strand:- start:191 stop:523 length:333 start_codon:yes stop_codon:yes gene_type:complete